MLHIFLLEVRVIKRFLIMILTFCVLSTGVIAIGDGNIDGGGGSLSDGTARSYWSSGNDGVRVTIVDIETHKSVGEPADLTDKRPPKELVHFGKVNKIQYVNSGNLSPYIGGYTYKNPSKSLPKIITSSTGNSNIEEIKSYFTDRLVVGYIAQAVGVDYNILVSGKYKILLEPIAYFTYEGINFAMTATEAALYDKLVNGDLRRQMGSLTHKNLPLSMFLETADLGFSAWNGSKTASTSNSNIISYLGLGIVRFKADDTEPPVVDTYDYTYRINTEVITSIDVGGGQSDPDSPISVEFEIDGRVYNVGNTYYPNGDSGLAWVKWRTPDRPQITTITAEIMRDGQKQSEVEIKANIVDISQREPPNPVADDRNDKFKPVDNLPQNEEKLSAKWGVWTPWWKENWVWISTGLHSGYWTDLGWWEFDYDEYTAELRAQMQITPDTNCLTTKGKEMKSGYGINQRVTANVSTTNASAVTSAQTAVSYFSEFGYETYWRLLGITTSRGKKTVLEFEENRFSTYNARTHFTPIWMPDGKYEVYTYLVDCWTPVGMLSANLSDYITIKGNLWDDWHIAKTDPY